mmetsp:Transcript_28577/g.40812  ORF Transcript_28577/g.40812 Transcript_28577/m.40812 type:complete len:107 (-) Transcript_28577:1043-1363(-)
MEEAAWLLLLVTAVVSFALLFTYMVDKIMNENDSSPNVDVDKTTDNEGAGEKGGGNSLKQEAASDGGWKCACEGGGIFLPPSLMRSVGGPSAFMRAGAGNCYHKQM